MLQSVERISRHRLGSPVYLAILPFRKVSYVITTTLSISMCRNMETDTSQVTKI